MLLRKARISTSLYFADKPRLALVSIAVSSLSGVALALFLFSFFDGVRYVDISGVKVPVECRGFCLNKD